MPDGTTRFFTMASLYHHMDVPPSVSITAVAEVSLAKINPEANHEHVWIPVGLWRDYRDYAVHNTAKVHRDSVAIFGLGVIGLAAVQGLASKSRTHYRYRHQPGHPNLPVSSVQPTASTRTTTTNRLKMCRLKSTNGALTTL